MQPTITTFEVKAPFKYLWMKYVTGVNLNVHCARCLEGTYSKRLDNKGPIALPLPLDEVEAKYFYICGVSSPYKWENNFHLAFRYKKGSIIAGQENGIQIVIEDAEYINIEKKAHYQHENGILRTYYTCRNWQFANQIADEF